ncbi:Adenine phosphoribosyltransferase [Cupriavidus sp. U2]|uniref:hypothetical protein n=1 Tax=Cupriavidus sp. U2 TaxID=2920269 RepID=UPI00129EA789|nr:hypothetical protein [Cupriavidus sp. U2]KAI3593976.1 Adenine phosphoribosyltransferase [Cupriavidus sp. U2]
MADPIIQSPDLGDVTGYLRDRIRTVPDWPQPGVQFRDITPLLQNPKTLRVLIDDLIATGGTMMAGRKLLERLGATVVEGAAIVDLPELGGSKLLHGSGLPLFTVCKFDGH